MIPHAVSSLLMLFGSPQSDELEVEVHEVKNEYPWWFFWKDCLMIEGPLNIFPRENAKLNATK